jgi:hypothetical protein
MPDGAPLILPEMDSIDASRAKVDVGGLNHNAYTYDPHLRDDLQKLVSGVRPPDKNPRALIRRTVRRGVFWQLAQ